MKKFIALSLLLSLLSSAVPGLRAQSRPRRVGQPSSTTAQPNTAPASPTTPRPDHTPVLTGAQTTNDHTATRTQTTTPTTQEVDENEVVRVNTTLVTLPVSVMDRDGKYSPDIRQDEFRIYEDGVEQQVAYFATVEKPFTVALVLDNSTSTAFKNEEIQDAANAFIAQLRADDRVLIVAFDEHVRVLAEPTSDRRVLRDAIRHTHNGGNTSLYDAIDFVIHQRFNRIEGRKAIVLFTDGVDTSSRRASYEANVRDAEEMDALVYPVQYDTYDDTNARGQSGGQGGRWPRGGGGGGGRGGGRSGGTISMGDILGTIIFGGGRRGGGGGGGGGSYPPPVVIGGGGNGGGNCTGCSREEYERGDRYLHDMARVTGGRLYRADTTRNLAQSFALIAEELRKQYSLGYYPKTPPHTGERRHIKVRVLRPNLVVQARDSYIYNPTGAKQSTDNATQRSQPVPQGGRPFGSK